MNLQNDSDQLSFFELKEGEAGYTLLEFIIVLVVVSIVGSAAMSLYLYSTKWINRWQEKLEVENSGHLLMSQVSSDLRHADFLEVIGDSLWSIRYSGKDEIIYLFADSSVYRNGVPFGRNHRSVKHFSIRLDSSSSYKEDPLLKGSVVRMMTISLELGLERSIRSFGSKIGMRQQKPWPQQTFNTDTVVVRD
ncbi:MAG: prepilin-type N-terminal cleavage/methylation domain-containing protein [Rhodothermales bacterium]